MDENKIYSIIKEALVPFTDKLDQLCTKNDLDQLCSKLQTHYESELSKRDEKLREMDDRLNALQDLVMRQKTVIENMEKNILSNANKTNVKVPKSEIIKPLRDLVVVGDSLIKHVNVDKVNQGGCNEIFCHPGAKIEHILDEVKKCQHKFDIEELLLCVGTNHINERKTESPDTILAKLIEMIKQIKQSAPNTRLYVTGILPKFSDAFTTGINHINDNLFNLQKIYGFKFISTRKFFKDECMDTSLFSKRDLIHLNYRGVAKLATSFMFR